MRLIVLNLVHQTLDKVNRSFQPIHIANTFNGLARMGFIRKDFEVALGEDELGLSKPSMIFMKNQTRGYVC